MDKQLAIQVREEGDGKYETATQTIIDVFLRFIISNLVKIKEIYEKNGAERYGK